MKRGGRILKYLLNFLERALVEDVVLIMEGSRLDCEPHFAHFGQGTVRRFGTVIFRIVSPLYLRSIICRAIGVAFGFSFGVVFLTKNGSSCLS
jgi:hypothetical protein